MSLFRKISIFAVWAVALVVLLWVAIYFYQFRTLAVLSAKRSTVVIQLPPGKGVSYLARVLQHKHLLTQVMLWKIFAVLQVRQRHLKAGEYEITPDITFAQLLNHILEGQVKLRQFTIIEGWSYRDLLHALQDNRHLKHVLKGVDGQQLLQILGDRQSAPEGLFFPDTYFYTWGESDFNILQQAFNKMQHVLASSWLHRAAKLSYKNAYQALIVASLIEKETAMSSEKPLVASVILNRLRLRMRLQIDPTVIYSLGGDTRHITHDDLAHVSPYNTYLRYGLPPTPICFPSQSSIIAALHPAQTDYLYYVARGDGHHQFSINYKSHLNAIRRYEQRSITECRSQHGSAISFLISLLSSRHTAIYPSSVSSNQQSELLCKNSKGVSSR